jgi:hypothetical protein
MNADAIIGLIPPMSTTADLVHGGWLIGPVIVFSEIPWVGYHPDMDTVFSGKLAYLRKLQADILIFTQTLELVLNLVPWINDNPLHPIAKDGNAGFFEYGVDSHQLFIRNDKMEIIVE